MLRGGRTGVLYGCHLAIRICRLIKRSVKTNLTRTAGLHHLRAQLGAKKGPSFLCEIQHLLILYKDCYRQQPQNGRPRALFSVWQFCVATTSQCAMGCRMPNPSFGKVELLPQATATRETSALF